MGRATSARIAAGRAGVASMNCLFHDYAYPVEMVRLGKVLEPLTRIVLHDAHFCPDPTCNTLYAWNRGWRHSGQWLEALVCDNCRRRDGGRLVFMYRDGRRDQCPRCDYERLARDIRPLIAG